MSGMGREKDKQLAENRLIRSVKDAFSGIMANVVPMVALWALGISSVLLYLHSPSFKELLEPVSQWQQNGGVVAAAINRVFFLALLPGVFLLTVRSIRPRFPWWTIVAYAAWGGLWGAVDHYFFTFQEWLQGTGTGWMELILKMALRQLVCTIILGIVPAAVFYMWVGKDFSWRRLRSEWPRDFFLGTCLTMLLANWMVWTPINILVYYFPLPLQIQLVGFAGAFWMLAALAVAKRKEEGKSKKDEEGSKPAEGRIIKEEGGRKVVLGLIILSVFAVFAQEGQGINVRARSEVRGWQTVLDRAEPIRWVWQDGADSATITISNRATRVVTTVNAVRAAGAFDGEHDVSAPMRGAGTDEAVIDVRVVQRAGGIELLEESATLAYVEGVRGGAILVRSAANRDWEHFVGTRVGLEGMEVDGYEVYRGLPAGLVLMFR